MKRARDGRRRSGGRRLAARVLLALSPVALGLASTAGETPPAAGPAPRVEGPRSTGLTEKVTVSLVLVEVVAVDRGGRHVKGLTRDDFTVREDGQVLPIASFDEIDLVGPAPAAPAELAPGGEAAEPDRQAASKPPMPSAPLAPAGGAARPGESQRRFVLVFDGYNNTSALRLVQARRAAKEFVRTKMGATDAAAVYEMSPFLRAITFFTSDRTGLDEALEQIRYFGGESLGEQITDNALRTGLLGNKTEIEDRLLTQAQFGASQAAAERRQFYMSLASLAQALEPVPGRKTLVLFSGGFPLVPTREEAANLGFTLEFREAIRALERARASIYGMDIGEEKILGDVTQGVSNRVIADQLGLPADFLERMGTGMGPGGDSVSAQNQILAVLSNESGGRFLAGRDYERSFGAVDDDTRHFYLIGWRPPEFGGAASADAPPRRDRYRSIDVSTNRKGVRIIARRGRYNWTRDLQPAVAGASSPGAARIPARPAAASTAEGEIAHRLRCVPVPFAGRDGKTLLTFPLFLDGAVAPIRSPGGGFSLDVSTRVVVRAGGVEIARKERSYRVSGKPSMENALRDGFRIMEAIEVAPGRYDLEAWVRLNGLGIEATWLGPAAVPDLASSGLRLSGLAMSGEASSLPPLVADVFTAGGSDAAAVDRATADPFKLANGWRVAGESSPSLDPSKPVTLFFRVYHAAMDPGTSMPRGLSLDYVLSPAAGGAEVLPPVQLAYFKQATEEGAFDVVARLDLSELGTGAYVLRVDAKDSASATSSHQERPLTVMVPSKPLDASK